MQLARGGNVSRDARLEDNRDAVCQRLAPECLDEMARHIAPPSPLLGGACSWGGAGTEFRALWGRNVRAGLKA